ncbi:MAG: deoxynucleoside kinase [Turicibacter sp.]|nr:deoxynucleoside kinase [Turicibacter sp.]
MSKKYLIAFEGIDGSGKTTQIKILTASLVLSGISAAPFGRRFLFKRALLADVLLLDRYKASWMGYAKHDPRFSFLKPLVRALREPDFTIYFRLDPNLAYQRILTRQKKPERLESLEYLKIFSRDFEEGFQGKSNVLIVDATLPPEEIARLIKVNLPVEAYTQAQMK